MERPVNWPLLELRRIPKPRFASTFHKPTMVFLALVETSTFIGSTVSMRYLLKIRMARDMLVSFFGD